MVIKLVVIFHLSRFRTILPCFIYIFFKRLQIQSRIKHVRMIEFIKNNDVEGIEWAYIKINNKRNLKTDLNFKKILKKSYQFFSKFLKFSKLLFW